MHSLVEQISQWEEEEREHRGGARTAADERQRIQERALAPPRVCSAAPTSSTAVVQDADAAMQGEPQEDAWQAPPTPRSAQKIPLVQNGAAHALRRRQQWEAELQARKNSAAIRPRQCTTPRAKLGGMSATATASSDSIRSAGTLSSADDRAVQASLGLAYVDSEVFFTADGTVFRRSSPPKQSSPQQTVKAHWSTTQGRGLRTPRPVSATSQAMLPWR